VSGIRLVVGIIVMGVAVPVILFLLLDLHSITQLLAIAAVTFLSWGVADVLSTILERPRLKDRSPGRAIREDWERRSKE
jgi:hypothetical protein